MVPIGPRASPVGICHDESPVGVPGSAREAMREGIVLGNGSTDAIRMTVRAEALRSLQSGGWS